jgi:L-threonylcarbamoyladenylate synthase
MPSVLKIDPEKPDAAAVDEVIRILQTGGIIAYPTETFYGLGCDAENESAIEKIYQIKGRSFTAPLSVIVGNKNDALYLIENIPPEGRILMETFWPGPLTLIFQASDRVPPRLTAHTGKIGLRISSHLIATRIANALGRAVTATSANLSGAPESVSAAQVVQTIGKRLDAVVDAGQTPGGKGSTIIDMTASPPTLLREGVIPFSLVQKSLRTIQ